MNNYYLSMKSGQSRRKDDETINETLNYIFTDRLREILQAERAPDEWECMINAYGELEGFMHTKCGHQSQSATHYCSNCGYKMAIAEAEAAQKEGF